MPFGLVPGANSAKPSPPGLVRRLFWTVRKRVTLWVGEQMLRAARNAASRCLVPGTASVTSPVAPRHLARKLPRRRNLQVAHRWDPASCQLRYSSRDPQGSKDRANGVRHRRGHPGRRIHGAPCQRQRWWINLIPGITNDDEMTTSLGFLTLVGGGGIGFTMCTWVPGSLNRRGLVQPRLGITHVTRRRAVAELYSLGVPVPESWLVEQDHPRRGLVLRMPSEESHEHVLAWALRAVGALSTSQPRQAMAGRHLSPGHVVTLDQQSISAVSDHRNR